MIRYSTIFPSNTSHDDARLHGPRVETTGSKVPHSSQRTIFPMRNHVLLQCAGASTPHHMQPRFKRCLFMFDAVSPGDRLLGYKVRDTDWTRQEQVMSASIQGDNDWKGLS